MVEQVASVNEWENPGLVGQNRLPPHATMMIFPDAETAKQVEAIATYGGPVEVSMVPVAQW